MDDTNTPPDFDRNPFDQFYRDQPNEIVPETRAAIIHNYTPPTPDQITQKSEEVSTRQTQTTEPDLPTTQQAQPSVAEKQTVTAEAFVPPPSRLYTSTRRILTGIFIFFMMIGIGLGAAAVATGQASTLVIQPLKRLYLLFPGSNRAGIVLGEMIATVPNIYTLQYESAFTLDLLSDNPDSPASDELILTTHGDVELTEQGTFSRYDIDGTVVANFSHLTGDLSFSLVHADSTTFIQLTTITGGLDKAASFVPPVGKWYAYERHPIPAQQKISAHSLVQTTANDISQLPAFSIENADISEETLNDGTKVYRIRVEPSEEQLVSFIEQQLAKFADTESALSSQDRATIRSELQNLQQLSIQLLVEKSSFFLRGVILNATYNFSTNQIEHLGFLKTATPLIQGSAAVLGAHDIRETISLQWDISFKNINQPALIQIPINTEPIDAYYESLLEQLPVTP